MGQEGAGSKLSFKPVLIDFYVSRMESGGKSLDRRHNIIAGNSFVSLR